MFQRRLILIVFLLGISLLIPLPLSAKSNRKPFDIYMIVWRGCEDACKGFQDYFRERDIEVNFILRNAARDKKRLPGFVREARKMKVDLVLTWGTSVTVNTVGKLGKVNPDVHLTDIPVVFMIVADPVGAKIIEQETNGPDVIDNPGQFRHHDSNVLGSLRRLDAHQLLNRQRVAEVVAHRADVIQAVGVGHVHDERVALTDLLMITVQVAHHGL